MEDYLNAFVEKECQHWDDAKWSEVGQRIKRALKFAPMIFGEYVFRKYFGENEKRKPLNRGLFESQTGVLSWCNVEELTALISKKDAVIKSFRKLSVFFEKPISLSSSSDFMDASFHLFDEELDSFMSEVEPDNEYYHFLAVRRDFRSAITFVTSKGWASNKRVEAMQYIFDQALRDDKETNHA